MEITDKFLAAIFAALIAGTMSLLIYVLDRSKEITKARKDWIEGLREEISIFLGNTTTIARLWEEKPVNVNLGQFRECYKEMYVAAKISYHKSLLHLNRDKEKMKRKEEDALRTSLKKIYEKFYDNNEACGSNTINLAEDVRIKSRKLFYREWEKVKDGEPVYRYVKVGATGLIFGTIPSLVLLWSIWVNHAPELHGVIITYAMYSIFVSFTYFILKRKPEKLIDTVK